MLKLLSWPPVENRGAPPAGGVQLAGPDTSPGPLPGVVVCCPDCSARLTVRQTAEPQRAVCPSCRREVTVNSLLDYYERKVRYLSTMLNRLAAPTATLPVDAAADPSLAEVGGLAEAKEEMLKVIRHSLTAPETLRALGLKPFRGVLLEGPPGCGKTLLVQAAARQQGINVRLINGPEFLDKWCGKSEENLRKIFAEAEKNQPTLIVFDEIDSFSGSRYRTEHSWERSLVNQFLGLLDGVNGKQRVLVVGTTNHAAVLDPALLRPGRFDRVIQIGIPTEAERLEILRVHSRQLPLAATVACERLAALTKNFSGAELAAVCRDAALTALAAAESAAGGVRAAAGLEVTELHFRRAIEQMARRKQPLAGGTAS